MGQKSNFGVMMVRHPGGSVRRNPPAWKPEGSPRNNNDDHLEFRNNRTVLNEIEVQFCAAANTGARGGAVDKEGGWAPVWVGDG
jgi:hypothetical protein